MEKNCINTSNVKGGRNYLLWQPSWIREMLRMMADMSTDYSYKANGQWKNNAYVFVAKQLDAMFGNPGITADHVNRQVRTQRRKWDIIQKVKSLFGASWIEDEKKIVMGELEAMHFSQENKEACKYLTVPILDYDFLEAVCGEGHATGQWARDSNDDFTNLNNVIELEDDETVGVDHQYRTNFFDGEPIDDGNYTTLFEDEKKRMSGTSSHNNTKGKHGKRARDDMYRISRLESLSKIAKGVEKMSNAMETMSHVMDTAGYRDNLLSNVYGEINRLDGLTEDEIEHCFNHFVTSNVAIASSFMIRPNHAKANFVRNFLRKNPIE